MGRDGKVALITGANRGIGLEIARQLGVLGMTVLIGARNTERGRRAAGELRQQGLDALDVTRRRTIAAAAATIERDFGKLDVLVNNAAIFAEKGGPPSRLPEADLRRTFETNFFGSFAVTQAMVPLLRRAEAARVVNVSSGSGSLTQLSDPRYKYYESKLPAYNVSKTALNALTVQFAWELRGTPIKVNSADPGYTATALTGYHGEHGVEKGAVVAVHLATLEADGPTGGFFGNEGPLPW
jgi:NAD(P)-dependent dehydrogenase (short-subunit alcohol dehydrogenase family)